MKKILLIIICFTLGSAFVYPQMYSMSLPIDNVMSSHNLRCITQDKNGFLWMGSGSGLFRYDGYRYKRVEPLAQMNLMPNNAVHDIFNWGTRYIWIRLRGYLYSCYDVEYDKFVDWKGENKIDLPYRRYSIVDDNNIWFYDSKNGCCHVNVDKDGIFTTHLYSSENKKLPSSRVNFVVEQSKGIIWIGTNKGLVRVKGGKNTVIVKEKNITCAQHIGNGQVCFVSEQGDIYQTHSSGSINIVSPTSVLPYRVRTVAQEGNQLILGTNGATYCYDIKKRSLLPHPYIDISNAQIVEDNLGNKVVFDHDGTRLWYITPKKTYRLNNIYNAELTSRNTGGRYKFVFGKDGNIYISTYGNGLFVYNTNSGEMEHYRSTDPEHRVITSDYLTNVFEDREGHIWLCQEGMGMCMLAGVEHHLQNYYFTNVNDYSHANTIRLIERTNNGLWVGNYQKGLWIMSQVLNVVDKENPYNDDVVSVVVDKNGRLWAGTRNKGVFVDGKPLSPGLKGKVSDILCDRKGRIWITIFDGGVYVVSLNENGEASIKSFFEHGNAIAQPRSMIESRDGRIWLCSNNGLWVFRPEELIKKETRYEHLNVSGGESFSDEVHCIYEDAKGYIWAGGTGYGLIKLDSSGKVIRRYTDKDGLPNNKIESIVEDSDGVLWIGTGYGLAKYSNTDDRFNSIFLSEHVLGLTYTEGCARLLNDGRIAMGTLHGMQVFNPKDIKLKEDFFELRITDIRINGVSVANISERPELQSCIKDGGELRLAHDENSLTFSVSTFRYMSIGMTKYSFWLEGLEDDWSEPQSSNIVVYKMLAPGKYKLHVRSYSSSGMQNEKEVALDIVIEEPWWNTWWAWMAYLLAIGLVVWVTRHHFRKVTELENKVKVETQLTDYKLRFFTNISHEFRTPLTIIRGAMDRIGVQENIPGNLRQPISSMQKSTDRLMRLINELLEFRKIQNQKLRLQVEETNVIEFLRGIFLTFSELAENHRIDYNFTTFAREFKMYVDRNFVDKMAYNLLSNAFKYTPRGKSITMRVQEEDGWLLMEVEDTGIGVSEDKQGELFTRFNQSAFSRDSIGIGLHMVSELVRVHHGSIAFRSNPAGGSIFSIKLPTDRSVYSEEDFLHDAGLSEEKEYTQAFSSYKEVVTSPMNDHEVLVVDDDDDIREYLNVEMGRYFSIVQAVNGEEALERIKAKRPALVISDVKMPIMNGFELVKRIRQDEELADLPVILLTAVNDEEKVVKGTEYGADGYIPKPFNINLLVAKCKSLIEQRDRLRQRYAKEVVEQSPLADIIVEDADKKFLERFDSWIYANISNSDMQFMDFATTMKMGRTTFFKKVRQVTGMAPHEYIRKARLTRAAELLADPTSSISEVAYKTGFEDPNYFSRLFRNYFGITASQFKKGKRPD